MFKVKHNRLQIGSGLVQSDGFGRFQDPSILASVSNGFLVLTLRNASAQSWYSAAPTLTLSASPSAAVNAVLGTVGFSAGAVTGVPVSTPGNFYSSVPAITFSGGGGTNAAATANLGAGRVTSVTVTAGGTLYTSAPTASIAAAPAAVTTVPTATMGNGYVSAVTPGGTLTGYTAAPAVTFTAAGSTIGATAHAVIDVNNGALLEIIVDNPGLGYTGTPTVTLTGGGGSATATALAIMQVTGFTVATFGYTATPTITAAHPNYEVIGVGGPGFLYAIDGEIIGLRDSTEAFQVIFPKPQEDNDGALTSPLDVNKVIIVGRVGTVTANQPFAMHWNG